MLSEERVYSVGCQSFFSRVPNENIPCNCLHLFLAVSRSVKYIALHRESNVRAIDDVSIDRVLPDTLARSERKSRFKFWITAGIFRIHFSLIDVCHFTSTVHVRDTYGSCTLHTKLVSIKYIDSYTYTFVSASRRRTNSTFNNRIDWDK